MIRLRIDELLEEKGKTKYWLAKKTDIDYHALSKLASGKTVSIRFDTIEKLSEALNVEISELFKIE